MAFDNPESAYNMKKIFLMFTGSLLAVSMAFSQQLKMAPTVEKTVAGNQYGSLLMYQNKSQWCFGGFYQTSLLRNSEGIHSINQFYGIVFNAPIVKSDKINFYFNARCGLVNQFSMVIAPGVETEINISKSISIGVAMSLRMTYPSAAARIYFKI